MKHGLITCDVCGAVGAKTCYFRVDRRADAAGSSEDVNEPMDLCDTHQWAAYLIAEKKHGFELANEVWKEMKVKALRMTEQRNAAIHPLLHATLDNCRR